MVFMVVALVGGDICLVVLFVMHGTAGLIYRLGKKKR